MGQVLLQLHKQLQFQSSESYSLKVSSVLTCNWQCASLAVLSFSSKRIYYQKENLVEFNNPFGYFANK